MISMTVKGGTRDLVDACIAPSSRPERGESPSPRRCGQVPVKIVGLAPDAKEDVERGE
jgi:hypothetical protein